MNPPDRPDLDVTLLDERASVHTFVLYPAAATDTDVKTTWIRFEDRDMVSLWETR